VLGAVPTPYEGTDDTFVQWNARVVGPVSLLRVGTEASAREHQHQRIVPLQLGELSVPAAVVRKLVVGEDGPGGDVGPQRRAASMWRPASLIASSGARPCSRATM
jgi:hypothetical protein